MATFYLGSPPTGKQTVSSNLAFDGINYLRSSIADAAPIPFPGELTPEYAIYRSYLPLAMKAAIGYKKTNTSMPIYVGLESTSLPPCFENPRIVWSVPSLAEDREKDMRNKYNCVDTSAFGKAAYSAVLRLDQVKTLRADYSPDILTPSSNTQINIDAYVTYVGMSRLVHNFMSVHQYPLWTGNTVQIKHWDLGSLPKANCTVYQDSNGDDHITITPGASYHFNMNNIADPALHSYTITDGNQCPQDQGYLILYDSRVARDDPTYPFTVIEHNFMGCLGTTKNLASAQYGKWKSGWGVLKNTVWGEMVAHQFLCLDLCIRTGGAAKFILTDSGRYKGFILFGSKFRLQPYKCDIIEPWTPQELGKAIDDANPHKDAMEKFFELLNFPTDIARTGARDACTSLHEVAVQMRTQGYNVKSKDDLRKFAQRIRFPKDEYLTLGAQNLTRVLAAMADAKVDESNFPLHPIALFEEDRRWRILSAFGANGPTFNIPGGNTVSIEKDSYETVDYGKKGKFTVKHSKMATRTYYKVVPYAESKDFFLSFMKDHNIITPIGTDIMNRASSRATIRPVEQGKEIIGALRKLAGLNPETGSGGSGSKRRAEDDIGQPEKRGKGDDAMDL